MPDELPPAPDKVFVLANPTDVLHKLYWEIAQLKKVLVEEPEKIAFTHAPAYYAFNCSVTAWHLADWIWEASTPQLREEILQWLGKNSTGERGKDFGIFQIAIMEKCRAIHICRQLATGSKHMTVRQHPDSNVRAEMVWNREPARASKVRAGDAAMKYSYQLLIGDDDIPSPAVAIFEDAFRFWNNCLEDWGFKESSLVVVGKPTGRP